MPPTIRDTIHAKCAEDPADGLTVEAQTSDPAYGFAAALRPVYDGHADAAILLSTRDAERVGRFLLDAARNSGQ